MSTLIPHDNHSPGGASNGAPPTAPRAVTLTTPVRPRRPSTVTLKVTMAITGLVFAAFVLVHMIGNLKIYTGATHFDDYAHWLRTLGEPLLPREGALWIFRVVLLGCLIAHVVSSVMLIGRAHRARGRFRRRAMGIRRVPATLMPYTGIALLVFIVIHILDLTTGTAPVASSGFTATSADTSYAYTNVVESLQRWPMAVFYLLVMVALGLHLVHGLWSVITDLGATGARTRRVGAYLALVVAVVVMLGNITIPIAVLCGWVG